MVIQDFPAIQLVFQIIVYLFLILLILKRFKSNKKVNLLILMIFLLKVLIMIIIYLNSNNIYGTMTTKDEIFYFEKAIFYLNNYEIPWEMLIGRNKIFIFINWLHYLLLGSKNIIHILVTNIFLGTITWIIFLPELKSLFKKKMYYVMFFLMIMPDLFFNEIRNLRDTMILFFFIIGIKYINKFLEEKINKLDLIFIVIILYFNLTLRFYMGFILIINVIILYLFKKNYLHKKFLFISVFFVLLFLLIVFLPGINTLFKNIVNNNIFDFTYNLVRNSTNEFYVKKYFMQYNSYNFQLLILTIATFYITPSPLKFLDLDFISKVIIIDNLLLISFTPYLIISFFNFFKKSILEKLFILTILLYTFVMILSPFLADARHRAFIMPFLFLLIFNEIKNRNKTIMVISQLVFVFFSLVTVYVFN